MTRQQRFNLAVAAFLVFLLLSPIFAVEVLGVVGRMVIEVTDEMVQAYAEAWRERLFKQPQDVERPAVRAGLAAVLAIVERDQAEEAAAVAEVVRAYRASVAKGYFRFPRGAVAWAVDRLSRVVKP